MDPADAVSTLAATIRQRRRELHLSQEALAAQMVARGDITFRQTDVSRLELGKVALPHRRRLAHLAAVLELSLGELLSRSGWGATLESIRPGHLPSAEETGLPATPPPGSAVIPAAPSAAQTVDRMPRILTPARSETARAWLAIAQAQTTCTESRAILRRCAQTAAAYSRLRAPRAERPGGLD
jgi:transcriptional regulator with XRE-family HTH domain